MAGRLLITSQIEIQIPGEPAVELGPRGQTYGINIAGTYDQWRGSVTNSSTVTVWDSTASAVSTFEVFWIKSSQDVMMEIRGTATADSHDFKLRANCPFYLTMDDCLAYNSGGNFAGSAQTVTKVLVKNSSGSTANVQAVAIL